MLRFVEPLRREARADPGAARLARRLLDLAGDEFRPMVFLATFTRGFAIPLPVAMEMSAWTGFGCSDVDDEEFEAALGPHIRSWITANPEHDDSAGSLVDRGEEDSDGVDQPRGG